MTFVFRFVLSLSFVAGALFGSNSAHGQSLYADPKARQTGDVITIVLEERTAASRESAWRNSSDANTGGNAAVAGGSVSGSFGVDATFNTDARNRNESVQSDLLSGTMSAQVVNVDQGGNLVIEGERKINVNGETHVLTVAGLVRPYDLTYDNTVVSHRIANANIVYHREGGLTRSFFKPGGLARIGAVLLLVAAVALGAS